MPHGQQPVSECLSPAACAVSAECVRGLALKQKDKSASKEPVHFKQDACTEPAGARPSSLHVLLVLSERDRCHATGVRLAGPLPCCLCISWLWIVVMGLGRSLGQDRIVVIASNTRSGARSLSRNRLRTESLGWDEIVGTQPPGDVIGVAGTRWLSRNRLGTQPAWLGRDRCHTAA